MFGLFTDVAESALNVAGDLLELEAPRKRDVAKLIDAGLTVYAISEMTGVAENVINEMIE